MSPFSAVNHFRMLGTYNRLANERIFAPCAALPDEEYRRERFGSFGSIHRTLNHILLADRIWMGRFTSAEVSSTPALGAILYDDFCSLKAARAEEDSRIEAFLGGLTEEFLAGEIRYINSAGKNCSDPAALVLQHMFNHATHHRGQVHVMMSDAGLKPVSLDMHRAIRPNPSV
jgi:uncharacterized damage-inducible protein DinB